MGENLRIGKEDTGKERENKGNESQGKRHITQGSREKCVCGLMLGRVERAHAVKEWTEDRRRGVDHRSNLGKEEQVLVDRRIREQTADR